MLLSLPRYVLAFKSTWKEGLFGSLGWEQRWQLSAGEIKSFLSWTCLQNYKRNRSREVYYKFSSTFNGMQYSQGGNNGKYTTKSHLSWNGRPSKIPVDSYTDVSLVAQLASYAGYENGNDSAPIGSLLISTWFPGDVWIRTKGKHAMCYLFQQALVGEQNWATHVGKWNEMLSKFPWRKIRLAFFIAQKGDSCHFLTPIFCPEYFRRYPG